MSSECDQINAEKTMPFNIEDVRRCIPWAYPGRACAAIALIVLSQRAGQAGLPWVVPLERQISPARRI